MSCRGEQAQQDALPGVGGEGPGSEFERGINPEGCKWWIELLHVLPPLHGCRLFLQRDWSRIFKVSLNLEDMDTGSIKKERKMGVE